MKNNLSLFKSNGYILFQDNQGKEGEFDYKRSFKTFSNFQKEGKYYHDFSRFREEIIKESSSANSQVNNESARDKIKLWPHRIRLHRKFNPSLDMDNETETILIDFLKDECTYNKETDKWELVNKFFIETYDENNNVIKIGSSKISEEIKNGTKFGRDFLGAMKSVFELIEIKK